LRVSSKFGQGAAIAGGDATRAIPTSAAVRPDFAMIIRIPTERYIDGLT
jgi:hypothetical protein